MHILESKEHSQATSEAVFATALYSAPVDERATPFCFLEDYETWFLSR